MPGIVDLSMEPEVIEQSGKLAGDGDAGFLLCVASSPLDEFLAIEAQLTLWTEGPRT